jgi:hypothetical protein
MANPEELFATAEELERKNYSLYNYVVEHGAARTRLQERIDGLEEQRKLLSRQITDGEHDQGTLLDRLTADITRVTQELEAIQQQHVADGAKFAAIYTGVEEIFNLLRCKWDEAPDAKTTATPANSMFCLSAIETVIAEMIALVYEKAITRCNLDNIKPSSFIQEDKAQEPLVQGAPRESPARIIDPSRPLSLEEIRDILDREGDSDQ